MMQQRTLLAITFVAGTLLSACDGGGAGQAGNNMPTITDITVERGPILYASVSDANGMTSQPIGNGVYRFSGVITYPIKTMGGYIDVNRSGTIDIGDIKAGELSLGVASGTMLSIASTLAQDATIKARLLTLGFTESQLLNNTPTQDKMIAALSDELYQFSVTNTISNLASITSAQLETLISGIQGRMTAYQGTTETAAQLEATLATTLAANIDILDSNEVAVLNSTTDNPTLMVSSLPTYSLSQTQLDTLVYMWNEEKLAKDVYLALNAVQPSNQLSNIANKAESQHQLSMESLLTKYNLVNTVIASYNTANNTAITTLAEIPAGVYTLSPLQTLYNTLYTQGSVSKQAALETGCKVEVTDVNDLNADLNTAGTAQDLVSVFESLRAGSYNHYWAFDNGLQKLGVSTGCCSLGTEYCHPEYPQ